MKNFSLSRLIIGFIIAFSLISSLFLIVNHFYKKPINSPPPPIAVGIVNLSVIRNEALVFKKFTDLINTQYKSFHSELLSQENDLRKNYDEVKHIESTNKTSNPELQKRRSEIDQKVSELEKNIRDKKDKLNSSLASLKGKIDQTIQEIIVDVSEKRHLNLVFNATILDAPIVLYGGKELDITPEIIKNLDQRLPTVQLP
jgi:outer membrane protein